MYRVKPAKVAWDEAWRAMKAIGGVRSGSLRQAVMCRLHGSQFQYDLPAGIHRELQANQTDRSRCRPQLHPHQRPQAGVPGFWSKRACSGLCQRDS